MLLIPPCHVDGWGSVGHQAEGRELGPACTGVAPTSLHGDGGTWFKSMWPWRSSWDVIVVSHWRNKGGQLVALVVIFCPNHRVTVGCSRSSHCEFRISPPTVFMNFKVLLDLWIGGDQVGRIHKHYLTGLQGGFCEAPLSVDTMGHTEITISMVLAEVKNVKTTTIGRPEGNHWGRILDAMKALITRCYVGLAARFFLWAWWLVICSSGLDKCGGSCTTCLRLWWCFSSTKSWFAWWKLLGLAFMGCTWQRSCWRHCFVNSYILWDENLRYLIGRR
jgi:hypothetical protein